MSNPITAPTKRILQSETEIQESLFSHAFTEGFSFALWRLPNNSSRHLILSRNTGFISRQTAIEDLPTGFIFAPFERKKDSVFLKADYSFSFDNGVLKDAETPLEAASSSWLSGQTFKKADWKYRPQPAAEMYEPSHADFVNLVNKSITFIEEGKAQKLVASRPKKIKTESGFNLIPVFQNLCKKYPNALISLVHMPDHGTWVGASPETLVTIIDKTIFKTVALAGTKAYDESISLKNVAWTSKEIEEQALVERYIISCFKKIRLREYDEQGPKTCVAGNLMHLRSDFTVDMRATNFPQLGSVMLQLLHPTSAVCGMPLDSAMEFLQENEGYDRAFYAGYLGPVNFNRDTNLYVNLRCMQLFDECAMLYAGAGVTIDSIAEEEWRETEMKFNTLLSVLSSNS